MAVYANQCNKEERCSASLLGSLAIGVLTALLSDCLAWWGWAHWLLGYWQPCCLTAGLVGYASTKLDSVFGSFGDTSGN